MDSRTLLEVVMAVCIAVILIKAIHDNSSMGRMALQRLDSVVSTLAELNMKVLMLKGLQPHHAQEDTFLPGGMSQGAYDLMMKQNQAQQGNDVGSDEQIALQDSLQDQRDYQRMRQSEEQYAAAASRMPGSGPLPQPVDPSMLQGPPPPGLAPESMPAALSHPASPEDELRTQ